MSQNLSNLIHYIIYKCIENPSKLGSTKLNKILWFCELFIYSQEGKSITGIVYVKQQFGPAPSYLPFKEAIEKLEKDGKIVCSEIKQNFTASPKKQFISLKEPNVDCFSSKEISIIDSVIEKIVYSHTASSISDETHKFHWWEFLKIGDEIPNYAVFSNPAEINKEDMEWAKQRL